VVKFSTLLVVAALLPWPLLIEQDNWWAFILVTVTILIALRLLLGPQWANAAGLNLPPVHALAALAAFAVIATGTKMLLPHLYAAIGLKATAPSILQQIGFLFQALNEEIFFRALLIGFCLHYIRSAGLLSLMLAFGFSAAHFLLYRFSNPLHVALPLTALATLLFAGIAFNNLYLGFRHIGFSWALHAGWNVVWLPAVTYDVLTKERLHEPELFDRVLGSPAIASIALVIAGLSFLLLTRPFKSPAMPA
jgi:hypothetical protein